MAIASVGAGHKKYVKQQTLLFPFTCPLLPPQEHWFLGFASRRDAEPMYPKTCVSYSSNMCAFVTFDVVFDSLESYSLSMMFEPEYLFGPINPHFSNVV